MRLQMGKEMKPRLLAKPLSTERLLWHIAQGEAKRETGSPLNTILALPEELRVAELRQGRRLLEAGLYSLANASNKRCGGWEEKASEEKSCPWRPQTGGVSSLPALVMPVHGGTGE